MSLTALSPVPAWERQKRLALIVGAVCLAVCALAALVSPEQFFRSYLVAFTYWVGIALGCLVLLMIQYLTGGVWGLLLRRILESSSRTLWLLALLSLPIALGLPRLYLWARENLALEEPERASVFDHYLNVPGFLVRLAVCFAIWVTVAYCLNRWSARQAERERCRLLSGPGLVLYGLTITVASIDWVMSLEPNWTSTMYPVLFATGQILEGMAFAVAVLVIIAEPEALKRTVGANYLRDLGNLLLAFVMIWAYVSFSQYLLIWSGNLPEEIPWYLRRTRGGWQWLALLLVCFHFSVPFLLLLFRQVKESARLLLAVAGIILGMRFVDIFWWIEPAFADGPRFFGLLDVVALAGVGGIWLWRFLSELQQEPMVPFDDREFSQEGMHHE